MIQWIRIRNLALVESCEIDFGAGFNVITGETGAGKSVLLGAVSLLLGERAPKNVLRAGADKCEISAGIALEGITKKAVKEFLENNSIENDGELLLKRVITPSDSRNFINDSPVTLNTLKQLGDLLIDIHGPHEHQSLLRNSVQLDILDSFGELGKLGEETQGCWRSLVQAKVELDALENNLPSAAEAEYLRSVVATIDSAAPQPNEDAEVGEMHKMAAHAKDILEYSRIASQTLSEDDDSIINRLAELRRGLVQLGKLEIEEIDQFTSRCDNLVENCRDLALDIERFCGRTDLDEARFIELEERLATLQSLKHKYGPSLDDVFKTAEAARVKLAELDNFSELRESLLKKRDDAGKALEAAAAKLSGKRKGIATRLSLEVGKTLRTLGFLKADFKINFAKVNIGERGFDSVEFMFSANPGEGLSPLRKVASSGEISRVMLALKAVLASADSIPVLVFDEIDVNIGGETAAAVGLELRKLGKSHQLLCISHLPQVAVAAERHFKVEKSVHGGRTFATVGNLDRNERLLEIARMLGGGKPAEKHAAELLKSME
ncbi:MAG: DNA repair protein RecN [Victivallales bacterium]|nr:DNA repair protein RecN [Victivallales bacterium]